MTHQRACRLLATYWGSNTAPSLPADIETEIEAARTSDVQTTLDILQRLAGDEYDWRNEKNWQRRADHFRNLAY